MPGKPAKRIYATPEVLHDAPVSNQKAADFHFDDFAATLARLIASKDTETPLVIGINGAWGSGKTSLLMRTRRMLDQTKVLLNPTSPALMEFVNADETPQKQFRPCRTVWFDAWKYGGEDQVLAALLRVILAEMQKDGFWKWLQAQKEKEEFQWVNFLGDALIQFASAGTYKPKIGDYMVETPLKQASAFFDYFDEALTRLLATWVTGKPGKDGEMDGQRGALVVFVDDLDRCLPEKTVQVLEAMKLFLDKPGCVFVLGADAEIVRQAVETHYKNVGITGENAKDYLEKVIQLRFDLPPILDEAMQDYLRKQGVNAAMLQRWKALVAAAEVNPRRVKNVINDLNLQWYMAVNAGQAEGVNRGDFICWQALLHAAPPSFLKQIAELSEAPELRHEFVLNAVKWQTGTEDEKKKVEGFYSAYQEARRLRSVLKQVQFSADFTPQALNAMIHMVAPPEKPAPQPEPAPEKAPAQGKESAAEAFESGLPAQPKTPETAKRVSRGGVGQELVPEGDKILSYKGSREGAIVIGDMEFMLIPNGKFIMGSRDDDKDADDDEKPQHTVEIPYDYWLARFTVTNEQYNAFVKARKGKHPVAGWEEKRDHPVVNVSWLDAMEYVRWLNAEMRPALQSDPRFAGLVLRLPTEAEWEKAARGAYGNIYPWGNEFDKSRCNSAESGKRDTMPVNAFPNGASPYGCEQMAGNVWEWTHTLFEKYPYAPDPRRENENDKSGSRVLRGGSFLSYRQFVRSARRNGDYPDYRNDDFGFRVCLAPISKL